MNLRIESAMMNLRAYADVQSIFSEPLKLFLDMYDTVGFSRIFGVGELATLGALKNSGLFSRTFIRLATMARSNPVLAARLTEFVERVIPIGGRGDFDVLPDKVKTVISRVYEVRKALNVLPGSKNIAGAMVEVRSSRTGRWRTLEAPVIATSEGGLHSEEVLLAQLINRYPGGNFRITHLFSERVPCVKGSSSQGATECTSLLVSQEALQGSKISTYSLPAEAGMEIDLIDYAWAEIFN
jgi:hypothetical protein